MSALKGLNLGGFEEVGVSGEFFDLGHTTCLFIISNLNLNHATLRPKQITPSTVSVGQ